MIGELLTLAPTGTDRFRAPPSPDKGDRIYGGQFLGQCLRAAQLTLPDTRRVHSLHGYFLRPGDVDQPIELTVGRVRDGRGFSTREVVAVQQDRERFRMLASFSLPAPTPVYLGQPMPEVPAPESVRVTYDDFTLAQTGAAGWYGADRPMELRYVNPPAAPRGEPVTESQKVWMRVTESLPDDPAIHQAALAYLADSTLVDHVMLPLGLRWQDDDFEGASLDHSMWFQTPARADAWLLFDQTVEATGDGRGLVTGRIYAADGTLTALCVQEGLMRWREGAPPGPSR